MGLSICRSIIDAHRRQACGQRRVHLVAPYFQFILPSGRPASECPLVARNLAVFVVLRRAGSIPSVDELISAHLRSLQSGRLIDVQSSDQHTVKPWFNGRLEVAPPGD